MLKIGFGFALLVHVYCWVATGALTYWRLFNNGEPPYNVGEFQAFHFLLGLLAFAIGIPVAIAIGDEEAKAKRGY